MTISPGRLTAAEFAAPRLNEVQRRAVDALQADGIAVLRCQALLGEHLWREALADVAPFVSGAGNASAAAVDRPSHKDDVILRRFGIRTKKRQPPVETLSLADPWLRIAASELTLDIVNTYREQWTRLFYVDNWFTVPYPNAPDRIASQQWHRDPEDEHVVKVFVYLSDVDEESGPFEYVRDSTTGGRYGDLWSWGGKRYPPQGDLEAVTSPEDRLVVTGPAGTMIVCDTGGFHRGGFARTKPRVLATFTYVGRGRKEGKRHFVVDFAGLEQTLTPQTRFALTA